MLRVSSLFNLQGTNPFAFACRADLYFTTPPPACQAPFFIFCKFPLPKIRNLHPSRFPRTLLSYHTFEPLSSGFFNPSKLFDCLGRFSGPLVWRSIIIANPPLFVNPFFQLFSIFSCAPHFPSHQFPLAKPLRLCYSKTYLII